MSASVRPQPERLACPVPPSGLSKDVLRLWYGWGQMRDKVIIRETASKGLHVDLAITFLCMRQKIRRREAKLQFEAEIREWTQELLERKQIVKVCHVLTKSGIDSDLELAIILHSTTNSELRDYIGNHLQSTGKLSDKLSLSWHFLKLMIENEHITSKYKLETNNIECLDIQSDEWKCEMATLLFTVTDDPILIPFLNAECLWKLLLLRHETEHVQVWINLKYNAAFEETAITSTKPNLIKQFKKFAITDEMINMLSTDQCAPAEVYNELGKFGIFCDTDKSNVLMILKRLRDARCITKTYDILSLNSSLVPVDRFNELLIDFCLKKQLHSVLNMCLHGFDFSVDSSSHLSLIRDLRALDQNKHELDIKHMFDVISVLFNGDYEDYFRNYPLVLIALIIFTKDCNIVDVITGQSQLTLKEINLSNALHLATNNLTNVNAIIQRKINGTPVCPLSMYSLISKHLDIDSEQLFKHRFDDKEDLIDFNNKQIVEQYGYSKKINYTFYLRQSRPVAAAKFFENSTDLMTNAVLKQVELETTKLAITHFNKDEITSACITFLELIQIDSLNLRTKIGVAKSLLTIGHPDKKVKNMVLNCEDKPQELQNLLDKAIVDDLHPDSLTTGAGLIAALKSYRAVIAFSKYNSLKLPEKLLKFCARNNLWVPFLIIAQIYNYPLEHMKLSVQYFKNPNMAEHISHSILNDIHVEDEDVSMDPDDDRASPPSMLTSDIVTLSESLPLTPKLSDSLTELNIFEIDINIKATLLQTLIRCHNSTDPPKALLQASQLYHAPLLAIFANCYEPDSLITNWLTWLAVSCDLCEVFTNYEPIASSANAVLDLLEDCMKHNFPRALHDSFAIFLPEHSLKFFTEFLNELILFGTKDSLQAHLALYKQALKPIKRYPILRDPDHEKTYLRNKNWIELVSLRLLASVLNKNCRSFHEQIIMIQKLEEIEIWDELYEHAPDFKNLLKILNLLYENNTLVRLDIGFYLNGTKQRQAVIECISVLLDKNMFDIALSIAGIVNLPADLILIKHWQYKFNSPTEECCWDLCNKVFKQHKITPDCAVDFFLEASEKVTMQCERYALLKLAWKWASNSDLSCQFDLECKMWIAFLHLDAKHRNLSDIEIKPSTGLYKDLKVLLEKVPEFDGEINRDCTIFLDRVLSRSLRKGNFWQALRLQKMFNLKNIDLEKLKLCCDLAEGTLLPYELNTEQRLLLSNTGYLRVPESHRRPSATTRLGTFQSSSQTETQSCALRVSESADITDSVAADTLSLIKLLVDHLRSGIEIGKNIFMTYRMSINTEMPYSLLAETTDYMRILKIAFEDQCLNKYEVVHDFTRVYKWPKEQIADFICEELINALNDYVSSNATNLTLWGSDLNKIFNNILLLMQDNCSILGRKIFSYVAGLHKSLSESSTNVDEKDLMRLVELTIRAHDCFTADCNVDGISLIVDKAKEMINNLEKTHDWKFIVRLLTGIGRYTEMDYVFHILRNHDQFEYLLQKGSRKDSALKVALLEYLKKFCPDNYDLYRIVALHFTLYSEVAMLWEKDAQEIIRNLISVSKLEMQNNNRSLYQEEYVVLQNNDSTTISLNKAMENYVHATEFHLEGDMLTKATVSSKQAELIALQLSLLNDKHKTTAKCILNLSKTLVIRLASTSFSFEQSFILVEAYNYHLNWADILYQQCVLKGSKEYLDAFLLHLPLTDALAYDLVRKFLDAHENTTTDMKNMKTILNCMPSVYTKYKLATQLGFTDITTRLCETDLSVYLKDTILKSGYKG